MGDYIIHDARFARLVISTARIERLWTGGRWVEGPVYVPAAKCVVWSDIPNDRLMRYDECDGKVSVFEAPCGYHNGHTLDDEGRIVACEHGRRRISRLDHDGIWRGLVDRVDGKRLNSPNDVVVHSDGSIWFTDPTYGIDSNYEGYRAAPEADGCNVYRYDPDTGAVEAVVTDMVRPNGLCFSPDETILYVADTGKTHFPDRPATIEAYPFDPSGRPAKGRTFATSSAGLFDGFRADEAGNIWTSTGTGVSVYAPDGKLLGEIAIPEVVSNLTFGGPKRNRLYITAQSSLYTVYVKAHPAGHVDTRPETGPV